MELYVMAYDLSYFLGSFIALATIFAIVATPILIFVALVAGTTILVRKALK